MSKGKLIFGGKFREKIKSFNISDSIPLNAGRTFGFTVISMIFFLNEEGNFVEK